MEQQQARLLEFIEASKTKGASDEFLAGLLARRGWSEQDVYAALGQYWERAAGFPIPDRPGRGESSRDAFLYLLSFSTLATWSSAFGSLLFRLIERWFPDPVAMQTIYNVRSAATWQMASIVVAFPIFLFVMRLILREAQDRPEHLESSVRKWLTYIALLLTAGSMICDLIWFLDYFLGGELTIRFVLKCLTVMLICGGIFSYYLGSLHWDRNANMNRVKRRSVYFAASAAAAVVLVFCFGVAATGTPSVQRQLQADSKRVQDLHAIASAMYGWHARTRWDRTSETLPKTLSQLVGKGIMSWQISDPETRVPYTYTVKSGTVYELCAAFSSEEPQDESRRTQFWHHGQGQTCFTLDASSPPSW